MEIVKSKKNRNLKIIFIGLILILLGIFVLLNFLPANRQASQQKTQNPPAVQPKPKPTARIMAHGDLLYHDIIYMSARSADGKYDFTENFEFVKSWIEKADLAIADFEGTISPNHKLGGYPLFNAPPEVVSAIKNAGYDVVDLAHNHILDSGLEGLISTDKIFRENGINTVGVFAEKPRSQSQILVKNVNGIKVAILAYSYGFNGMEAGLSQADYDNYLSDLNEEKMREEIMRAEEIADATIVMPQMGNEYQLQPTAGQIELYRKMVDWGADVVLGGHPHVAEPAEIIQKNGDKKLIIYSMGNFLSNQRIETLADITANAKWTERGVLVDFTLEKDGDKTIIKTAEARPTWVNRTPKGARSPGGIALYKYQTLILEDFIEGGKHRSLLDTQTQARIDSAYSEMNDFMKLKFSAE